MTDWTPADLTAIGHGELRVAARRPDGTLRPSTIVWHVVVDGAQFIRSVRGEQGAWYRAVRRIGSGTIDAGGVHADVTFTPHHTHDAAIGRAYQAKYGNGSPVRAITSPAATATTLALRGDGRRFSNLSRRSSWWDAGSAAPLLNHQQRFLEATAPTQSEQGLPRVG